MCSWPIAETEHFPCFLSLRCNNFKGYFHHLSPEDQGFCSLGEIRRCSGVSFDSDLHPPLQAAATSTSAQELLELMNFPLKIQLTVGEFLVVAAVPFPASVLGEAL